MSSADLTRINTNIQALNSLNALNNVNRKMSVHQLRLATGKRINSAADDAAGFTIASKLMVKSKGLGTALDNIGSAKNLMTVAEGHLNNINDILVEMKSKAQQAANGTLGAEERAAIVSELQEFNNQIDAEVAQAQWAGGDILSTDLRFQIGTGTASADRLSFNVANNVDGVTGFTSSDLSVDIAATGTASVSTTSAGVFGGGLEITAMAQTAAFSNASEVASGLYTLEINTAHSTADSETTFTVRLRDQFNNLVTLDADGATGGDTSTVLSTTIAEGATQQLNLGVGFTVDLGSIATDGSSGSAVIALEYERGGSSISDMDKAGDFMAQVDTAINNVTEGLSYIGSMINRLNFQEESIAVAKTNTEAAHSRIVDADMAWEQLESTKMMILQQTATAMLSQANMAPQSVLALFG